MKLHVIEAIHSRERPGNWGKFAVGRPDEEWDWRSAADSLDVPLLRLLGWGPDHLWVFDLQTGEGAFFRPAGYAAADLEKHRIWVCPLFEPFLEWLYKQDLTDLGALPRLVELPDAEFAFSGYRRSGLGG